MQALKLTETQVPLVTRTVLMLAFGIGLLPERAADWPLGLVATWNEAVDAGAFRGCVTLGDHARAFLRHRLEQLA